MSSKRSNSIRRFWLIVAILEVFVVAAVGGIGVFAFMSRGVQAGDVLASIKFFGMAVGIGLLTLLNITALAVIQWLSGMMRNLR